MSLFRLTLVLFALGLAAQGCQGCTKTPVSMALKEDGEACGADEECQSSLCDKLPGKPSVCFKKCSTGCKMGEICTSLAVKDRYACVPEIPGLCQPCALNVDCPYPGDRCIEIDGTKVCARDCSFDGQCPSSFRCADGTDTNGEYVTKQCQPTSGTCNCTASTAGQTVPCSETNSFGTCMGVRTCRPPAGYEACTASVPTTESCNGRDDDCNGMTDENLGETTCGTGECRRTVTNCVNGTPQVCDPLMPGTEICDNKDNDCDGVSDDGFDKMTSLDHCGACNTPCIRAHATPVCMGGMCGIGACDMGWVNADGIDANGCELACTVTGPEICDGTDNDCDGRTDEDFTLATDPRNCGQCGRVCNVNNGNIATYACVAGVCGIATCSTGFDDCDQTYPTGCEQNVSASLVHCGACNTPCATPNATPVCASGTCTVGQCQAGFGNCDNMVPNGCEVQLGSNVDNCGNCGNVCPTRPNSTRTCTMGGCGFECNPGSVDLDQLPLNGCEYACTATGADAPDLLFNDSNCDGIDGDAANAIFVALPPLGNDANPGTRSAPKATISTAVGAAAGFNPRKAVYVSKGTYTETVVMQSGVSVFGGYDAAAGWQRATANATIIASATNVGVLAQNLSLPTELQLLDIRASNAVGTEANGDGRSSIGVHIVNSGGGVTVRACKVTAGTGTRGANGASGAAGAPGGPGGNAGVGGVANLGGGGGSSCNAPGGNGAQGVSGENNGNSGSGGTQASGGGAAGNPGSGGAKGGCNVTSSSSGFPAPAVTAGGGNGDRGPNAQASFPLGTIASGAYVPASGQLGGAGKPGGGGGGGGSGGGTALGTNFFCTNCDPVTSGGGGGGGGGGCGGVAGAGGRGGGGSFAILIVSSVATVTGSELESQAGGAGGNGGSGGGGGAGGTGGNGSVGQTRNECTTRSGGRGANGASGGIGGHGGGGSGGAGGPSVGIAYFGTAPSISGNTVTVPPTGAAGGTGGSDGIQNAASGPVGVSTQVQPL